MNRKIELLLQVAADFHDFCAPNTSFSASPCSCEELTESDLDMVSAAVKSPTCDNTAAPDNK